MHQPFSLTSRLRLGRENRLLDGGHARLPKPRRVRAVCPPPGSPWSMAHLHPALTKDTDLGSPAHQL